jgi:hypothetical protein
MEREVSHDCSHEQIRSTYINCEFPWSQFLVEILHQPPWVDISHQNHLLLARSFHPQMRGDAGLSWGSEALANEGRLKLVALRRNGW